MQDNFETSTWLSGPASVRSIFLGVCITLPILWTILVNGTVAIILRPDPVPSTIVESEFGAISHPEPGARVTPEFRVRGELRKIGKDERVWLATEKGGELWPKVDLGSGSRSFDEKFVEHDEKYYVTMLMVGEEGSNQIAAWRKRAQETGQWPGIPAIAGAVVAARIKVRR